MSDELAFSGGGRVHVDLEAVRRTASWVRRCAADTERAMRALYAIDTRHPVSVDPTSWGDPGIEWQVESACRVVQRESRVLTDLADEIEMAWSRYYWGDTAARRTFDLLLGYGATSIGSLASATLLGLCAANPLLVAAAVFLQTRGAAEPSEDASAAEDTDEAIDPSGALASPVAAALMREAMDHTDDFLRGMLFMPPWLSALLDDDATGLFGREEAAAAVALAAAGLGMRETAVTVHRVRSTRFVHGTGPVTSTSLEGHVSRTPDGDPKDGRIVVDEVLAPDGSRRWNVYLGGTSDEHGQPMDMTSNIRLMAHLDSGSFRAAEQAMADAGVKPGDHVSFVGYSQGGLLASRLIQSGQWHTDSLLTVGSPGTWIELPGDIPTIALEHREDVITALNGRAEDDGPVTVTRSVLDGHPGDGALAGHHLEDYLETAAIADDTALDPRTAGERERLLAAMGGTVVASTTYAAQRVPPVSAPTAPPPSLIPNPTAGPAPLPTPGRVGNGR